MNFKKLIFISTILFIIFFFFPVSTNLNEFPSVSKIHAVVSQQQLDQTASILSSIQSIINKLKTDIQALFGREVKAATETIGLVRQDCTGYSNCFTSLSAWEAAYGGINFGACVVGDLVCADKIAVAQIDGVWISVDTTAVVINGWTTDATHYIRIYTTSSARHRGVWDTNKYRLEVSGTDVLNINENYVRIDGLQFKLSLASQSFYDCITVNGESVGAVSDIRISNNIIWGNISGTTQNSAGIITWYASGTAVLTVKIWNNYIYGFTGSGFDLHGIRSRKANYYAYNNTIYNTKTGIYTEDMSTFTVKNNIVEASVDGYLGTFTASSNYNISNLASDAPSLSYRSGQATTVAFVDATNKDFHLSSSDTSAKDAGINLSTDANLAFSDDIDGNVRSAETAWDIGADEYSIVVPPDISPPILSNGSPAGALSSGAAQTTLSLTTDENATCKYGTIPNTAYTSIANTFITTGGTSHSQTITVLTNGMSYNYYVRCSDSLSNVNTTDYIISFSVSSSVASDTQAPTIPTNLTVAAVSSSQINLSWTASTDNVGVAGYKIYRCTGSGCAPTTQIVTSLTTSYSDTGLTASTTYAVSAYDAAGNESGQSTSVSLPTHQPTAGDYGAVEPTIDAGARTVTIPAYNPSRRVVDVPSGSFSVPYVADGQNTEYRLTGDIIADGTAIEVTTNNITINLNGYTITYDQKIGNTGAYGVLMKGWTHRNIGIFNGTIIQGDGQTPGRLVNEYGMGANPINGMSVTNFEIGGLTIIYKSQDIGGIFLMGSDIRIHHNTIEDKGTIVSNRHQGLAAIETKSSKGTQAYGNLVARTRQIGIRTGADSKVYDNDITIDSYATNSAGITGWGLIYGNKVIGTGEHPIGAYISGKTDSVKFYNNYIDVQNTRASPEYDSAGSAAFRTIWGSNLEVYDNTFIIHAENNYQGTDLMSWGRAVWVSIPDPSHKAEFRNNLIIALNTDGNAKAAGVGIVADNMSTNLVFRNNTIVSNWSNILLADSYGHADGYAHFINNTLIKAGNTSIYKTIRSQYQHRPSTAIMVNNIFQEGASLEDIDLEFSGDAIKDIATAWNVSVAVKDESGNPAVGAIVSIKNKNGKEVFSGITASDGLVKAEVIGQRITNIVDGLNTKEKNIVSEGPHTITITVTGKDPESTQANIDDNKNFTYTLGH